MNAGDLVGPILAAVEPILKKSWGEVREYAETEAKKMADTLANITKLRVEGRINDMQAEALLDMQKHAMQAVLMAVEGIGLIAAQKASNAALDAVKDIVNKAIGFGFL